MTTKELEELQVNENKKLLDVLELSGDKNNVERLVVHKLEFISEYKKSDLLEKLEGKGFTINETFVTEEGYNGLTFQREDKVDIEIIEVLTLELIVLLDEYDARYAGWTTEVIK